MINFIYKIQFSWLWIQIKDFLRILFLSGLFK